MKPKPSFRSFLALFASSLLAMSSASAANLYWDSNGTTAGLGDTAGTWGSSAFFRTISAPDGRGLIDGTLSPATTASATADTVYFGTVNLALGATASTIAINGTNVTARMIVFGAGQGSQGVTLSGGGGKITMDTTAGQFPLIVANNSGTNTIGAELAGTLANALGIYGPGTVLLTGTNTFTGGLVVRNGATLQVGNGTSGSLTSQNLTFNNGAGVFNVRALNAGSTQAMGTLNFGTSGIGDGTVQSTYGSSGNAELSFTSLAARGAGATGNFVVSGGTNGTTNKIVLTGAATGFLDKGLFFGGSSYAAYDATGYVRGLIYGTDTDAEVSGTIAASKHVQLTSSPAAHAGDTLLSLNLSGGGVDYTMDSGSLTVPAILKSGDGAVSTISGGTSVTTGGTAELVIRTDTSSDLLTISSAVTGFSGGLTKTGAGTLTLSGSNDYTGGTRINAGTLVLSGGSALVDNQGVAFANVAGATLQLNSSETINDVSGGGFSGGNVNVGANTLTLARATGDYTFSGTFTGTGGIIKQGTGKLTLQNKNAFAGTITLAGGTVSLTYGNEATTSAQSLSSGGAINMADTTTLNFTPGSNLLVGTLSNALNFQASSPTNTWTIGNDIKVTSGTANITFGASNGSRFTFNGGVSGSSTPATPTTLAVTTHNASFDNASVSFSGVIQDGIDSTSPLGLNLTHSTASTGAFISLTNSNTFTGPISLNTTGTANGWLVIGGLRNSAGLTTGSGSLGTGGVYNNTIALTDTSVANVSVLNYASSADQTLGGIISGTDGRLQKEGAGTLTLSVTNSYTGSTTVSAGTLLVNGSTHASSAVTVTAGTLGGTGTIFGNVTIGNSTGTADAILAPGAGGIDSLDTANLTFLSDGSYAVELNGTSVTTDVTNVTGTVAINAATTLTVNVAGTLSASQRYFIVINDDVEAVAGAGVFAGLAQDAVVGNFGGTDLKISYTGDSGTSAISGGNDIVLYTSGSGSAYDTWKAANAPGSNPNDDTDGDGVPNAVEFVLGGTSTTNDRDKLPQVATDGTNMTFTFKRKQSSIDPKTSVSIEVGTDLVTWNTAPSPYTVPDGVTAGPPVTVVKGVPADYDTITLTVAQDSPKKFARLKVVITP